MISRVSHGKKGKIKIIKSLLLDEHPCEYAIFLNGFLEKTKNDSVKVFQTVITRIILIKIRYSLSKEKTGYEF